MRVHGRLHRVILVGLLGVACAESEGSESRSATVRDSGGVEIVESRRPHWETTRQAWRIDPRPLVDIGVTYGTGGDELTQVRGVLRLADGRIVIGELRARIKYFDSTGKHLTTLARRGQGPGEGNVVTGLHHYRGDSILMRTGRSGGSPEVQNANVLDASGKHGRALPITWPRGAGGARSRWPMSNLVGLQGVLDDGSFVVRGSPVVELSGVRGPRIATARFFHVSADGARADSILTVGALEVEEVPENPNGYQLPIFGMEAPKAAVDYPFMYSGDGSRFEIGVYDLRRRTATGVPRVRTIRATFPTPPIPTGAREQYIRHAISSAPTAEGAAAARARLERLPVRTTLPAFRGLLVDSDRNLWVEHYRVSQPIRDVPPDTSDVPRWTVFDPSGAMLGDLLTPRGLQIMSVGVDWVMGVWADPDGVEHVRVHRLVRR